MQGYFQQPNSNMNRGYVYNNMQVKKPQLTNPLGQERIKELLSKGNVKAQNLTITQDQMDRAICTHRDHEGNKLVLVDADTNTYDCAICGQRLTFLENLTEAQVKEITEAAINIMNTVKLTWLDLPVSVGENYFQAQAVIEALPELYKLGMNNYNSYFNANSNNVYRDSQSRLSAFGTIDALNRSGMQMGGFGYNYDPNMMVAPQGYDPNMAMGGINPMMPQGQPQFGGMQQPMFQQPQFNNYGTAGMQFAQPVYGQQQGYDQSQMAMQYPTNMQGHTGAGVMQDPNQINIPQPQAQQQTIQSTQQPENKSGIVRQELK